MIRVIFILTFISVHLSIMANAEAPIMAAFIRDYQLWIKKGEQETQITKGKTRDELDFNFCKRELGESSFCRYRIKGSSVSFLEDSHLNERE